MASVPLQLKQRGVHCFQHVFLCLSSLQFYGLGDTNLAETNTETVLIHLPGARMRGFLNRMWMSSRSFAGGFQNKLKVAFKDECGPTQELRALEVGRKRPYLYDDLHDL